jgi:hypothetical protein
MDAEGVRFRASLALTRDAIAALTPAERKAANKSSASIDREHWRIDAYRPVGAPSFKYDLCRAFNSPCGPDWCDKEELSREDVPGHKGPPIKGCTKNGKWTVHGCCRCGAADHPWTQCVMSDLDIPPTDLSTAAMPARDPEERKAHRQWKKEHFYVPQQTNYRGRR